LLEALSSFSSIASAWLYGVWEKGKGLIEEWRLRWLYKWGGDDDGGSDSGGVFGV